MMYTQSPEPETLEVVAAFPQLGFEIDNLDAPNTIYISTDPKVNDLTFSISTNTTATFAAGTPVAPNKAASASGSLVYLNLTPLQLTVGAFSALQVAAAGWQAELYPSSFTICLAPAAEVTLDSADAIAVTIGGFTLPNPPSSASVSLQVTYYRVSPITIDNFPVPSSFGVRLQQPPAGHANLKDAIAVSPALQYVVVDDPLYPSVDNTLQFILGPGPTPRDVKASKKTAFVLTFVYAPGLPGYGALMTAADAAVDVTVNAGAGADSWKITPGTDQQNPSWLLKPPAGASILGGGPRTTVEFDVAGISTSFRPGPTLAILSYSGIDGYDDGAYQLVLQKTPHVSIVSLDVAPNPSVLTGGSSAITISWTAQYAGQLTLYPLFQDVTGLTQFATTIAGTTQFSLQAVGRYGSSAGNVALKNVTAYVTPQIDSFTTNPSMIASTDFPRDVALTWNVNTNGQVKLVSSVTGPDPSLYQPQTTITKSVNVPQMFTLIPVDATNPSIRRLRLVTGFDVTAAKQTIPGAASAVAASPSNGFVAVANAAQNTVSILGTLTYQAIGSAIQVGKKPGALAFSPDGSLLFVGNAGDGTVSVVSIQTSGGTASFSVLATLPVGGAPQGIAVAPDARYVYVSVDNAGAGSLAMLVKGGNGQYTAGTPIAVGKKPRGVAVLPTGARAFVANAGDDSVTVVGNNGGVLGIATTVHGLASAPADVAVTPDGATLLVVCSGSSTVYALSATAPNSGGRYPCIVGTTPTRIAQLPAGGYAFVANNGGSTVSVLKIPQALASPSVSKTVQTGSAPQALAVSGSGGLVIAANADASLSILTLAQYAPSTDTRPTGGGVDSVAVAPDGSAALVWHNLNVTYGSGGKFATGIAVYDVESETVATQLAGQTLSGCAYLPGPALRIAAGSATSIAIVDATTFQTSQTLALPAHGATATLLDVGASADGGVLAALVALNTGDRRVQVFVRGAGGTYALTSDVVAFADPDAYFAVAPDGATIYAVDADAGQLWYIVRGSGGTYSVQQQPVSIPANAIAIALSPDGSSLYAINRAGFSTSLTAIDTLNGTVTSVTPTEISAAVSLTGLSVSPDGATLFATDSAYAGVRLIDAASLQYVQTVSWTSGVQLPNAAAALPDGSQLFVANINSANFAIARLVQPS